MKKKVGYIKQEGDYTIHLIPNVEYVNPIEFDFNNALDSKISLINTMIRTNPEISDTPKNIAHNYAVKNHAEWWEQHYKDVMDISFPDNFFEFLNCNRKKKQEAILDKMNYNTLSMQAIFYKAWFDYDFTFSFYKVEKMPKVFENKRFPKVYHLQEDNTLNIVGDTDMSEGQLRAALKQRNVVLAKFLDKGKVWHCFLYTYDSIMGNEVKSTQHIHYLSSAFGNNITRERVLTEILKFRYKFPSLKHLKFNEEGMKDLPSIPPEGS